MEYEPVVTVGIPVFNSVATIGRTLNNIAAQSYGTIEIIIGDNASDDGTSEICERFAAGEQRCSYVRSDTNMGIGANFSKLALNATGKYFMWAAADDCIDLRFVEHGVRYLEANETVVLAVPHTRVFIPTSEKPIYTVQLNGLGRDVVGIRRYARSYVDLPMTAIYGLFRMSAVRQTSLIGTVVGSDVAFMQEISWIGPIETNSLQQLDYHARGRWNSKAHDHTAFSGPNHRRWRLGPGMRLFVDRISRLMRQSRSAPTKVAVACLFGLFEARRMVFALINRILRVCLGVRLHRSWIQWAYWRWLHSSDVEVSDRDAFVERVVLQRFAASRHG